MTKLKTTFVHLKHERGIIKDFVNNLSFGNDFFIKISMSLSEN